MGGELVTVPIVATGTGAKYADAYEWCWAKLRRTLEHLGVELDPDLREYVGDVQGRLAQQRYLKARPYGKKEFLYSFPGQGGLGAAAAALWAHWLRIALALWKSEEEIWRCNVRLAHNYDARVERAREHFVHLRGHIWDISSDAEGVRLHRHEDETALLGEELDEAERERVSRAVTLHCACDVCDAITPTDSAAQRLLALVDGPHDFSSVARLGFWIASLLDPSATFLAALVSRIQRPYEVSHAHARISPAFYRLAQRNPLVVDVLRDTVGSENTWASAVALHAVRAEAEIDPKWVNSKPELIASTMVRSLEEAIAALALLRVTMSAMREAVDWSSAILVAVQRFGHNTHIGAIVVGHGLELWRDLHEGDKSYPPPIVEVVETIRSSYPANHPCALQAEKILTQ